MTKKQLDILHTSDLHVATFDKLLGGTAVDIKHWVRPDWLTEAINSGVGTRLAKEVHGFLEVVLADTDAFVCTCSTLGPLLDCYRDRRLLRVDAPMIHRCVLHSGVVVLAVCLSSTVEASSALLEKTYADAGKHSAYEVFVCDGAWSFFERGQQHLFVDCIAGQLRDHFYHRQDIGAIALAQMSMAGAAPLLGDLGIPVYAAPDLAVQRLLKMLAD